MKNIQNLKYHKIVLGNSWTRRYTSLSKVLVLLADGIAPRIYVAMLDTFELAYLKI
jgi:hypothetical protein